MLQRKLAKDGEMISRKPLIGEPVIERVTVDLNKPQAVKDEDRLKSIESGFKRIEKVYPIEVLLFHCSVSAGLVLLSYGSEDDLSFFSGFFALIYILAVLRPSAEIYKNEKRVRKINRGLDNLDIREEHSRLVKSVADQKSIIEKYYKDLLVQQKMVDEENSERLKLLKDWWADFNKKSKEYEYYLANQKIIDRERTHEKGSDVCEKNITKEWVDEQRKIASRLKKKLVVTENCPYCGDQLGRLPHGDHIIPVTNGGKSVIKNMVNVCNACNIEKSDYSLKEFCAKSKHARPYKEVKAVLVNMGKIVIDLD